MPDNFSLLPLIVGMKLTSLQDKKSNVINVRKESQLFPHSFFVLELQNHIFEPSQKI